MQFKEINCVQVPIPLDPSLLEDLLTPVVLVLLNSDPLSELPDLRHNILFKVLQVILLLHLFFVQHPIVEGSIQVLDYLIIVLQYYLIDEWVLQDEQDEEVLQEPGQLKCLPALSQLLHLLIPHEHVVLTHLPE
jgi:hypothetical protein